MSSGASTQGGVAAARPQIRRQVRSAALMALSAAILTPCFFGSPEVPAMPAPVRPVAAVSPVPTPAPTPDPFLLPRPTPAPLPPPRLVVTGDRGQDWVALTFDADMT